MIEGGAEQANRARGGVADRVFRGRLHHLADRLDRRPRGEILTSRVRKPSRPPRATASPTSAPAVRTTSTGLRPRREKSVCDHFSRVGESMNAIRGKSAHAWSSQEPSLTAAMNATSPTQREAKIDVVDIIALELHIQRFIL